VRASKRDAGKYRPQTRQMSDTVFMAVAQRFVTLVSMGQSTIRDQAGCFIPATSRKRQAGLRAFDSTAPAPATLSADDMKWSPEKAGGGSIGYNTHDEVKN
jgi:hypothetical protein